MGDRREFQSGDRPKSQVRRSGFQNFLSTIFGFRRRPGSPSRGGTGLGRDSGTRLNDLEFVNVDLGSEERLSQALGPEQIIRSELTGRLEELFQAWLNDTTDNLKEIGDRRRRADQLTYAVLNDPFLSRVVGLYADEATQIDMQDRLISIESPDPRMTREMYRLLQSWGVTQQRIRNAIEQLATYGDAFWSHKITEQGVERIAPLKQLQVTDRLEFSPMHAHEKLKRLGGFDQMSNRENLIRQMLEEMDGNSDIADLFDTKLFGFVLEHDFVVPPWSITHFRVNADGSDFYPFGRSPILGTLAPFKLTASTITLQSIARILSFPVTLYKVKTADSLDPARQFEMVDAVREHYDNIGVQPAGGTSETYTVNTKIWVPDGLLSVETVQAGGDHTKFIDDIEMYQDRVAVATGIPKGYLVQEWGGFGNSAISLTEQWKPFARSVYALQAAFLEGLSDLFRLHFAINGKFDFRTPFTLSLKFPGDEMSSEKLQSRESSMDLATSVIDLIRSAIGADEEEPLSPDIVRDILAKYTFLDPVDITKWTRDAERLKSQAAAEALDAGADNFLGGGDDFDFPGGDLDLGGGDEGGDDIDLSDALAGDEGEAVEESAKTRNRARLRELTERYKNSKDSIYFQALRENTITSFTRNKNHIHVSFNASSPAFEDILERVSGSKENSKTRLNEETLTSILAKVKNDNDPRKIREADGETEDNGENS